MTQSSTNQTQVSQTERAFAAKLNSIIIVARYHGVQLSTKQLILDNQLNDTELSSKALIQCAQRAGLKGKLINLKWQHLAKLKRSLPAILFCSDGTPLVLTKIEINEQIEQITLLDPSSDDENPIIIERARLERLWSGQTLLLKRDHSFKDENQPFGMRLIASLILAEKRILRDVIISAIFLSILTLVPILFFRLMTDRVVMHHAMSTFTVLCIALALCIAFETVFAALRRALLLHLTTRVDVKITTLIFERVLRQPIELFETTPVGLIARNMSEATKIRAFISNQLLGTLLDSLCLMIFIPVMFVYSSALTFLVLASCALICVWTMFMLPSFGRKTNAVIRAEGERGSFLVQSLQGIRTIKSLALEPAQIQKYETQVARVARLRAQEGNLANIIQSAILPVERFMISGVLAIGVYSALTSNESSAVAGIFVFLLLSQRLVGPLRQLAQLIEQYEEARASVDLVSSMVNNRPEDARQGNGIRQPVVGELSFSSVRFQYKGSSQPALNNVNFEIAAGTTLGIMGRSGSGKTTVTRLLQRLHDDYDGLIKIDGIDVREYALDHLRSSLGVVLQDNFLFSGTIRENITAAKVNSSFEDIVRAARMAGAEEFIDRLPRGYETFLNEGATNISGGQRQRIAIARALITDPRILILDEATSALDPDSEAIVNANLQKISAGRTVIVISHRLSSLVAADSILVLERGQVHDIAPHNVLLDRCEIYRDLWNQQNGTVNATQERKLWLVS